MTAAARISIVVGALALWAPLGTIRAQDSASSAVPTPQRAPAGVTATDTSTVRESPHWQIPLFLIGGGGAGMIDGAVAGAVAPTRCFGNAGRAAGNGAGAGLAVVAIALAGSEISWHVLHRRPKSASGDESLTRPGRRGMRRWLLTQAAIGGGLGAATGALAGLALHVRTPQTCFGNPGSAALHGALIYGATGALITVPLAILSAS